MARDAEKLGAQAQRIKRLRELARDSQETVAHEVGVSVRRYGSWERGDGDLSTENLKKLATYFATTPDYIEYGVVERTDPLDVTLTLADQLATQNQLLLDVQARLDALLTLHAGKPVNIEDYISQVLQRAADQPPGQSGSRRDAPDPGHRPRGARPPRAA